MTTPRFSTGISSVRLIQSSVQATSSGSTTREVVEGEGPAGTYLIRGLATRTRTNLALETGDVVTVLWQRGAPFMILDMADRKGTGDDGVQHFFPIVEELIGHPDTGEVWFRNYHTFKPILFVGNDGKVDAKINPQVLFAGMGVGAPQWGRGHADYFTVTSTGGVKKVAVYKLMRPNRNTPFKPVPLVRAKLVRLYNFSTDSNAYGQIFINSRFPDGSAGGTADGPLTLASPFYFNPGAGFGGQGPYGLRIESFANPTGVAPNGDLLAKITVRAQAGVADSGQAGLEFSLGSLIVNVTTSTIVANHLAREIGYVTSWAFIVSTFVCQQTGSAQVGCTIGVSTDEAGEVHPLSFTGIDPKFPEKSKGTMNNYLLIHPAWWQSGGTLVQDPPGVTIGQLFCAPARADLKMKIVGEYAGKNPDFATFLGDVSLLVSKSPNMLMTLGANQGGQRGMIAWATGLQNSGIVPGTGKIRDLVRGVTSPLQGNLPPFVSSGNQPPIILTESMLIYKVLDTTKPFNKQFFVGGHDRGSGKVTLNLDKPTKFDRLKKSAPLAKATTPVQILLAGLNGSIQVLVYQPTLGSLTVKGPL